MDPQLGDWAAHQRQSLAEQLREVEVISTLCRRRMPALPGIGVGSDVCGWVIHSRSRSSELTTLIHPTQLPKVIARDLSEQSKAQNLRASRVNLLLVLGLGLRRSLGGVQHDIP